MLNVRIASRAVGVAARHQAAGRAGDLGAVRVEEDDPELVLALGLGRGDEQADDQRQVRVAERERPAADPRDAAAQDVELLAGLGLGGVGEEGEVDLRHGAIVAAGVARPAIRRSPSGRPRRPGGGHALAGRRDVRDASAFPSPFPPTPGRPASSANVTSLSGTSGSPRRTRARYSPVAEPGVCGDLLGRALGDDPAAAVPALGPEVDDPVRRLDHVEVVLDHEDRVAGVDEPVEDLEQLLDVGEVEAGRRLVEQVERLARSRAATARWRA